MAQPKIPRVFENFCFIKTVESPDKVVRVYHATVDEVFEFPLLFGFKVRYHKQTLAIMKSEHIDLFNWYDEQGNVLPDDVRRLAMLEQVRRLPELASNEHFAFGSGAGYESDSSSDELSEQINRIAFPWLY